jgi:predicted DNA-binding protein YlxM (UPF0122 family)
MKRIIKLTESDLTRIVERVINEDKSITMDLINKVKNGLSPKQFEALSYKHEDNLSTKEISDKMDMSYSQVSNLLKKGSDNVKKQSNIIDKNPPIDNNKRKVIKMETLDGDIRSLIEKYSKDLSKEEIYKIIRKVIN